MKKILNVEQIRAADQQAIVNEPISSLDLMERASNSFVDAYCNLEKFWQDLKVMVVCGPGNNGGDGLAIARILKSKGVGVQAVLVALGGDLSPDCRSNLDRIEGGIILSQEVDLPDFSEFDIIMDGLFGSGLSRAVTGLACTVIEAMNNSGKKIYSIDVPSGLYCDRLSDGPCIVRSSVTISFQRPKLSFFFPENGGYLEKWVIADIGLDEEFIEAQESNKYLIDDSIGLRLKPRQRQSHKGSYGHALLLAGSYGKIGAAILSAKACLRSGAGLLTCYLPRCGYDIMQGAVPEAMCLTDDHLQMITAIPELDAFSAIGIGPGLGVDPLTSAAVEELLRNCKRPIVLDADALNIIARKPALMALLGERMVLTPHIKEFDRLVGPSADSIQRFEKLRLFSMKYGCVTVLKNAYTCICSPSGELFFNMTGNQGMATGGSGDVLTGMITALLAQGYSALDSALLGVYYHGKAGDEAASVKGYHALIASDLIEEIRLGC